jgi:hypothetical protein
MSYWSPVWSPLGTAKTDAAHDQSPVEEASGPESADDGCKDQQLAGRQLQQHEAPEVLGLTVHGLYGLPFVGY